MKKRLSFVVTTCTVFLCALLLADGTAQAASWRAASESELKTVLPTRAPVIHERIETEMRTASGITDGNGHFVAGIVLIAAGYSADGKYSHYFVSQVALKIGGTTLKAGEYVLGWQHMEDGLSVNFYEAATGRQVATVEAKLIPQITRVESFRVWPPSDRGVMQIGRFSFPYQIEE